MTKKPSKAGPDESIERDEVPRDDLGDPLKQVLLAETDECSRARTASRHVMNYGSVIAWCKRPDEAVKNPAITHAHVLASHRGTLRFAEFAT